jgi:hypothetical protein
MATPKNPKLDKLMARMTDLSLSTPVKDFMGMIYGIPGTSKTTTAMGLAQALAGGEKIVYVDTAQGWVALEQFPALMENAVRFQYDSYDDLPTLAGALALPEARQPELIRGARVVVLDEASGIADAVLDRVLRERLGTKDDDIPNVTPEWSDYFPQKELVRKAIIQLQEIEGLHVILVAHEKEKIDDRKVKIVSPDFPNKLLGELQKLMHVTARATSKTAMKAGELQYIRELQSQPTARIEAKSRIPALNVISEQFDWVSIVADWVLSGTIAETLAAPEIPNDIHEDIVPVDGTDVAPDTETADAGDEPTIVED